MVVGDDPRAVVVGEERVVEVGQESGRRRRVRVGERPVGEVEQLTAILVPARAQARPQRFDHLAQLRQPGPRLHVPNSGGTERAEVAKDHVLRRGVGLELTREPRFRRRMSGLPAGAPDTPRRHLDERHERPDGLG